MRDNEERQTRRGESSEGMMVAEPESMDALIENCADELVATPFVQSAGEMRGQLPNIGNINAAMTNLLDQLAEQQNKAT